MPLLSLMRDQLPNLAQQGMEDVEWSASADPRRTEVCSLVRTICPSKNIFATLREPSKFVRVIVTPRRKGSRILRP